MIGLQVLPGMDGLNVFVAPGALALKPRDFVPQETVSSQDQDRRFHGHLPSVASRAATASFKAFSSVSPCVQAILIEGSSVWLGGTTVLVILAG